MKISRVRWILLVGKGSCSRKVEDRIRYSGHVRLEGLQDK
jgi:hypothetical protein